MPSPYSWFNSRAGPRKGAIVRANGTIVHLDYTNRADTVKVRDTTDRIGMVNLAPIDGKWTGTARSRVHGGTVWNKGFDTASACAADLIAKLEAEVVAETALTADPVAHLERELERHDWYAAMSDDHRVYVGGNHHGKEIRALMANVPLDTARALFTKHAPSDHVCPV